jgi:hypothetical protein
MEERNSSVLEDEIQTHLPPRDVGPVLYTARLTGKGVHKVLEAVEHVYQEFDRRIPRRSSTASSSTPSRSTRRPEAPPSGPLPLRDADARAAADDRALGEQSRRGSARVPALPREPVREEFGFEGTPLRIQVRKKRRPGTGSLGAPQGRGGEDSG